MVGKHFLDTSVLHPHLTASPKVKQYYKNKLTGNIYICDYVKMEFLRGYIKSCIDFYFILAMPQYEFADALNVWSHKFQIREHKNIEIMMSNLIRANAFHNDKQKCKRVITDYIRRLVGKLHENYRRIGNDNTYCPKGTLRLNYDPDNIEDSFKQFREILANNEVYKKCKINIFVKERNKSIFRQIAQSSKFNIGHNNRDGFDEIQKNINSITSKEITCAFCSKIGDAVICILSDKDWILEHTDHSFDFLCEILKKKHY